MSYKGLLDGEEYTFTGSKYLLNQIIRQYIPSEENFYISKDGYELWKKMSNESIWGYSYTNRIIYEGKEDITLEKYTGNSNATKSLVLHHGDNFYLNDFYTDEHMIDVASIIEVLIRLNPITPQNIKSVLDKIHIARILKTEDKKLKPNHNRLKDIDYKSIDIQHIYNTTYKGIDLLKMSETKQ
ncbi:MAG: hypothetical protein IK014_00995 [Lachnospiraceae bacterium]|nr:hypothetical protein [Lachnospiraceae bacterium]